MNRFSQHQWGLWEGKASAQIREQLLNQADLVHSIGPWLSLTNGNPVFDAIAAGDGLGYNASPLFGLLQHSSTWTSDRHDSEFLRLVAAFEQLLERKSQLCQHLDLSHEPRQIILAYQAANVLDQFEHRIAELGDRIETNFRSSKNQGLLHSLNISAPWIEISLPSATTDLFTELLNRGLLTKRIDQHSVQLRLPSMLTDTDIQWLVRQIDFVWQRCVTHSEENQLENEQANQDRLDRAGEGSQQNQFGQTSDSKMSVNPSQQTDYAYRHYRFHSQLLRYKHSIAVGRSPSSTNTAEFVRLSLPSNLVQGKVTFVNHHNWGQFRQQVEQIQHEVYEPARRTSIEKFDAIVADPFGFGILVTVKDQVAGMGFAGPLQLFPDERGTLEDPFYGDRNTLYVLDVTVAENFRGSLGTVIKQGIMLHATAAGRSAIHGRNRDRLAGAMWAINLGMGSYQLRHLIDDYPDQETYRDCIYYRCPLRWPSNWRQHSDRFVADFLELEQEEQWATLARMVNGGMVEG